MKLILQPNILTAIARRICAVAISFSYSILSFRRLFLSFPRRRESSILLFLFVFSFTPTAAFAYVDPNTGGYIFQIFFPILSAIAFGYLFLKRQIIKAFNKVLSSIKTLFSKKD